MQKFVAGNNITISSTGPNGSGIVTINSTGGGNGGGDGSGGTGGGGSGGTSSSSRIRYKSMLEAAGVKNLEIDLWYMPVQRPYNPNAKRIAEMMQADLAKVGVNAKLVTYEWGEYRKRAQQGEHMTAQLGWTGDNGDPDNFFFLRGCAAARPGGQNLTKWCNKDYTDKLDKARGFQPVEVAAKLDWDKFAAVSLRQPELPGVAPTRGFARNYPAGAAVAHLTGYVGAANAEQYKETHDPLLVTPGFKLGKDGLEKQLEKELRGTPGAKRVEVTARGKVVAELPTRADVPGKTQKLTIDAGLQEYAARRLGTNSGSAVVMDCRTGEMLAMVSMPAYDPNSFSDGISHLEWKMLSDDDHVPLMNKVTQGLYPPGSTVKPMNGLALLAAGVPATAHAATGAGTGTGVGADVMADDLFFPDGSSTPVDGTSNVPEKQQGGGGSVQMRGLGNGYTQMLVNGERPPPGFSLESLSPDQVERIEVIRGPVAEHSTQAIAGTINIITREGRRGMPSELKVGASFQGGLAAPTASLVQYREGEQWSANYTLSANRWSGPDYSQTDQVTNGTTTRRMSAIAVNARPLNLNFPAI